MNRMEHIFFIISLYNIILFIFYALSVFIFSYWNKMLKMYLCNVNLASLSTALYVDSSKVAIPI